MKKSIFLTSVAAILTVGILISVLASCGNKENHNVNDISVLPKKTISLVKL
ncbi:MAG: hypothetical protein RR846_07610 [Oscillospiraceae bacterium]